MLNKKGFTAIELLIVIAIIALIVFAVVLAPHLAIWAINSLVKSGGVTNFHIGHTFMDWLAMFVLLALLGGTKANYSKKN